MDYEVGYKKPPHQYDFKKGVSGNPAGRPKKVVDPRVTAAQRAWDETIEIEVGRRMRKITVREFAVRMLVPRCVAGDLNAIEAFYMLRENDPPQKLTIRSVIVRHMR